MAINTIGVTLKWGETPITTQKVEIKDFPDIGGIPEPLDATTHSNEITYNILGLPSQSSLEFTCNYTKEDYLTVQAESQLPRYYSLSLGDSIGSEGVFTWEGQHVVRISSKKTNEVMDMIITVAPSSAPMLAGSLVLVQLAGSAVVGSPTSAMNITSLPLVPVPAPYYAYQWLVADTSDGNYTNIVGATSATYTPVVGDVGKFLKCDVFAGGSIVGTARSFNYLEVSA